MEIIECTRCMKQYPQVDFYNVALISGRIHVTITLISGRIYVRIAPIFGRLHIQFKIFFQT